MSEPAKTGPTDRDLVRVEGLHKSFTLHTQGGVTLPVLKGVDLAVAGGDCVVLSGPSGSGKSTLLRCLYGNYRPDRGRTLVRQACDDEWADWLDLVGASPRKILAARRTTLGYVSQFLRVIPRVATLDLVMEPLKAVGVGAEEARVRASGLLTELQIPERLWPVAPATFSGGEQQRVNIARSLAVDYPILLLDEPTASLDSENRARVMALIEAARQRGAAIVGIFHDPEVREALATREVRFAPAAEAAA